MAINENIEIIAAIQALDDSIKALQLQRNYLAALIPGPKKRNSKRGDFTLINPRTGKPSRARKTVTDNADQLCANIIRCSS